MEHTTASDALPALLQHFLALLQDQRPAFRQHRSYQRMCILVVGVLCSLARHTLTQALLAGGGADVEWSPFYRLFSRERIRMDRLQQRLIHQTFEHVVPTVPYLLAVDGVFFPRSSRHMPGVGWRKAPNTAPWRPGLALGQRFGALHWLPPLTHGYTRALPLVSYPIFTPKARPARVAPQKEWEGAYSALTTLRHELDRAGRSQQQVVLLADGSYDVADFWKQLPHHTALLARTARNRALYELPVPTSTQRGRPRKYGPPAPRPAEWLQRRSGWQTTTKEVRGHARRMRYRVEGPFLRSEVATQPVFLVVMGGQSYRRGQQRKHREPVPVLVSAVKAADGGWRLPVPLDDLLVWLWQRWEVEVAHRELKSGFGVGEMQCWHPVSTVATIQWGIWLYAVCLLAAYRTWGICGGPRPLGRWRRTVDRWSFTSLWRSLRMAGSAAPDLMGGWHGIPDNWTKKALWSAALSRTSQTTARL
ncbi:MAG: transposase [Herpetosiphonaceae bacterium]|nr:transposase [Herpetosiphonaceae bacterium]